MIDDLMVAISRRTQESPCIDVFGSLLMEIEDEETVCSVVADMNRFITYAMTLFEDVDKISNKALQSQLLTYEFIKPARFFKNTWKLVQTNEVLLRAINNIYFHDSEDEGAKHYTCHQKNVLAGELIDLIGISPESISMDMDSVIDTQEDIRKIFLLWNYCPTIVKAILQTKRRQLGFDNNSQKFK